MTATILLSMCSPNVQRWMSSEFPLSAFSAVRKMLPSCTWSSGFTEAHASHMHNRQLWKLATAACASNEGKERLQVAPEQGSSQPRYGPSAVVDFELEMVFLFLHRL